MKRFLGAASLLPYAFRKKKKVRHRRKW